MSVQRHQEKPGCLSFTAKAKSFVWFATHCASAGEAQGYSLTDLIAHIIGHSSLGPVQLLPLSDFLGPWLALFPSVAPQVVLLTFGHSFSTSIFQIYCYEDPGNL